MENAERSIRVLLVEDEPIVLLKERRELAKGGYTVETASNANEAIVAAQRFDDIDMLVTDVDLGGGMDGIEAARVILGIKPMPVLFLSACDEASIRNRAEDIGSFSCVSKGGPKEALLEVMESALKGRQDAIYDKGNAVVTHQGGSA
jgi:Response regulator containing a CheY-like receiver domain and an HTH DNA-binding domain